MIHEIEAVKVLTNYAEFTILDGDLEHIDYHTDVANKPSVAQIKAKVIELEAEAAGVVAANNKAKTDLLAKLGITSDEAAILLG